jgi:Fe-S cluster biogenesis protein NfuA
MFIQTEPTPNPNTLKFLPGESVAQGAVADYSTPEAASDSKLAAALFAVDGVTRAFFGADFISLSKTPEADWAVVKPLALAAIMDYYTSGSHQAEAAAGMIGGGHTEHEDDAENAELIVQIKELLDTRVRPSVANDGGDIVFRAFKDGVVYLHMQGACSGCPSSTATLKHGIENLLRYYVPEVQSVESVD